MLTLLLVFIFAACVGFLYNEGMWGNAIRLVNVVTAALLATNYFEPAAQVLEDWFPSFTYFVDFLALWGLFAVLLAVLLAATDWVSRVKVRFVPIVNRIGGAVFAAWIGWVMVGFTLACLHTAPLARNFLSFMGGFQPEQRMFFGLAPDRQWLAFTQKMSRGSFSRSGGRPDENVFDRRGEFMPKYASRRTNLEKNLATTGSARANR